MGVRSSMFHKSCILWLGLMAVLLTPLWGRAESVDVSPTVAGYGVDGGAENGWVMDGVFDSIQVNDQVVIRKYRSLDFTKYMETRGVYEFKLPEVLAAEGVVLESAVLHLPHISSTSTYGDYLRIYGYVGDGELQLTDFEFTGNQIAFVDITFNDYDIEVTEYIDSIIGLANHVGFNLDVSWWDVFVSLDPAAELKIIYAVTNGPVNEPPQVDILQPIDGSTFYEGFPITFTASAWDSEDGDLSDTIQWYSPYYMLPTGAEFTQAFFAGSHAVSAYVEDSAGASATVSVTFTVLPNTVPEISISTPATGDQFPVGDSVSFSATASDAEDGDISASIQWSSSLNGPLGVGANVNSTELSPGEHTIIATVFDSAGAETSSSVTIQVFVPVNAPPQVSINTPSDGAQFLVSDPITLEGQAYDDEDGDLSASILWSSDISGALGEGPTVTVQLPEGTHAITAQVVDSDGTAASANISIVVDESYCSASGLKANYEWIESVLLNGFINDSGANGGYADFTSNEPIELVRGTNSMSLKPGFGYSSYREYWSVWIDYNQDNTFSVDELVFTGNSTTTLSGSVEVPDAAISGETRMRVAMRYGGTPLVCGTFTYGEVEDYTVMIPEGGEPEPPPPPPPVVEYCDSWGSNTSYEWIEGVKIGSYSWISGRSYAGYTDHTTGAAADLRKDWPVSLVLEPGFRYGSYVEHWRVWVDWNQDGTFADDELLYSGSSSSTINTSITVPTTAVSGETRMRVSMKYGGGAGPCGTFTYGEVEDFSANIHD